jgi:hypothetical protein
MQNRLGRSAQPPRSSKEALRPEGCNAPIHLVTRPQGACAPYTVTSLMPVSPEPA